MKMTGAESGNSAYQIGGVCLTYEIGPYCCQCLFELRAPPANFIFQRLAHMVAKLPKGGDSGSWIETDSDSPDWCGLLVGGDHLLGYACEAQDIIDAAQINNGLQLVLA